MGVTTEVIAAAVRRAGLETSGALRTREAMYREAKPYPVVRLDGRLMTDDENVLYVCQCLEEDRSVAVLPYSPSVYPGRNFPFIMHFSRYVEGTQHPLKPAGVMIQSRMYGVWVGQCEQCKTIYVAQREL